MRGALGRRDSPGGARADRRGLWAVLVLGQAAAVLAALVLVSVRTGQSVVVVSAGTHRVELAGTADLPPHPPIVRRTTTTRIVERQGAPLVIPGGMRRVVVSDEAAPTWVEIPRFGVRAPIVPKGIAPDGAMDTPPNPAVVGWYIYGAHPGDPWGTTVLDGHVDSAATGPGAFFNIVRLQPGDTIVVGGPTATVRYVVTQVTERRKSPVSATDVFRMDVPARLVLITCGGAFNPATRHYVDNVVVFATPV